MKILQFAPSAACLAICLLPALTSPAGGNIIQGSGVAKTEKRMVADFTEVEVRNAIQLEVIAGPPATVEVTADDNLVAHVVTKVTGGKLVVSTDGTGYSTQIGVKVKVAAPALTSVKANGASRINLLNLKGKQFQLITEEGSMAKVTSTVEDLRVTVRQAASCTLAGEAKTLTITCDGAAQVDAANLKSIKVQVVASNASRVEINATQELQARATAAANIRFVGRPAKLNQNADISSTIAPK
jgi:hypothetical protein